jgi:hypothetical protein
MAARKPTSDALASLCQRVNEEGYRRHGKTWKTANPRQIERWTSEHLIPAVDRPGRGRGLGREPRYNDDHVAAIVEAGQLIHRYRSTAVAGAVLFMRGRPIPIETIRKSYTKLVDRFDATITALADKQRAHLGLHEGEAVEVAELAEPLAAQQLASHPDMRLLREHLKQSGLGVQSTLENLSALMIQIFSTGTAKESDLKDLQTTLSLPVVPVAPEVQPWLPSDDNIRQASSATGMREIIDTATIEDFYYARAAAIMLDNLFSTPEIRQRVAGYGLDYALRHFEAVKDEEVQAMFLMFPLIFRVRFGVNIVPVPDSLIYPENHVEPR